MKKIVIGSDKSGFYLKEGIKEHLESLGFEVDDLGTQDIEQPMGFFQVAPIIAEKISNKEYERGILICGTGTGMAMVANKFPGVYAAECRSTSAAHFARAINNANVLTMGGWLIAPEAGTAIVDEFLNTEFLQGLEDWRQKNLTNAFKTIQEMEKKIYQ